MTKSAKELLDVLQAKYKHSKLPFSRLIELKKEYGNDVVKELNELRELGFIRKRDAVNGALVELLKLPE